MEITFILASVYDDAPFHFFLFEASVFWAPGMKKFMTIPNVNRPGINTLICRKLNKRHSLITSNKIFINVVHFFSDDLNKTTYQWIIF